MNALITGSSGLVGSACVEHFCGIGWSVHGVDCNMRMKFFGAAGDTRSNRNRLIKGNKNFTHHEVDITNRAELEGVVRDINPDLIIHAAAQPSHDLAASCPFDDFSVNASGTLNVLESIRVLKPECVLVYLSTNKVYGDRPNKIPLIETETRWDLLGPEFQDGIGESMPIDQTLHSLFGVSKLSADVLVQEYGRYFGIRTCCLRAGCITGANHSGVELHGFLNYLIRCNMIGQTYTIHGYKGKQVRDNIHAKDVARFAEMFFKNPKCGEVYNIGGGRRNSISIIEAIRKVEELSKREMRFVISDTPRKGDHICYISDLTKIQSHYPSWSITINLDDIFSETIGFLNEHASTSK